MATPTIAMIPSSFKAGKLGSVLPLNGDGDFTFTRAGGKTRINKAQQIEVLAIGVPSIDYTGGGCPSLLLEPQATNLITYSKDFSNAAWIKSNTTVISGKVSPSGDTDAYDLLNNNATNQAYISSNITVTPTNNYTFSVFVKKGNVRYIALLNLNPFTSSYFDLQDGVALASSAISSSIEDYGNGWFRCSVETVADTTTKFCGVYLSDNGTNLVASGIPNGDGVEIYGAQLEEGELTSYVPTAGVIATRIADVATLDLTTFTLTSITETIGGVEQTPITVIPSTYTAPYGAINKIIME